MRIYETVEYKMFYYNFEVPDDLSEWLLTEAHVSIKSISDDRATVNI